MLWGEDLLTVIRLLVRPRQSVQPSQGISDCLVLAGSVQSTMLITEAPCSSFSLAMDEQIADCNHYCINEGVLRGFEFFKKDCRPLAVHSNNAALMRSADTRWDTGGAVPSDRPPAFASWSFSGCHPVHQQETSVSCCAISRQPAADLSLGYGLGCESLS